MPNNCSILMQPLPLIVPHTLKRVVDCLGVYMGLQRNVKQAAEALQKVLAMIHSTQLFSHIKPKLGQKIVCTDVGKGSPEVLKCMSDNVAHPQFL